MVRAPGGFGLGFAFAAGGVRSFATAGHIAPHKLDVAGESADWPCRNRQGRDAGHTTGCSDCGGPSEIETNGVH